MVNKVKSMSLYLHYTYIGHCTHIPATNRPQCTLNVLATTNKKGMSACHQLCTGPAVGFSSCRYFRDVTYHSSSIMVSTKRPHVTLLSTFAILCLFSICPLTNSLDRKFGKQSEWWMITSECDSTQTQTYLLSCLRSRFQLHNSLSE